MRHQPNVIVKSCEKKPIDAGQTELSRLDAVLSDTQVLVSKIVRLGHGNLDKLVQPEQRAEALSGFQDFLHCNPKLFVSIPSKPRVRDECVRHSVR